MNDKRLNYVRTGADTHHMSSGEEHPHGGTSSHVTSATLGHMRASSVLNETFMSTKKSLNK